MAFRQSTGTNNRRLHYLLIKISLPIVLVLLIFFGRDARYPLAQWPMYSWSGIDSPADQITATEYRVYYDDGTLLIHQGIVWDPWDDQSLLANFEDPALQANAAREIVRGVVRHSEEDISSDALPTKLEVWEYAWPVDFVRPPHVDTTAPPASQTLNIEYTFGG